jgi:cold shock CspA family protein
MPTGKIKCIVENRGYGFIVDEDIGDVFFHASELTRPLVFSPELVGKEVAYTIVSDTPGKSKAKGIVRR